LDNRPGLGNNNNINIGGGNNINNINNWNRPNRPDGAWGGGGWWGGGYRPGWAYHQGWVNGYWHGHYNNWNWGSFGVGAAVGGLFGWGWGSSLYGWGLATYANPYYMPVVVDQPVVIQQPVAVPADYTAPYDYSQPISTDSAPPESQVSDPAVATFDQGREAFKQNDFAQALQFADQALKSLPNDATIHEFRALCLFALQRYGEAAQPLYAILSVGPGWDWTTMIGLYSSVDVYTQQVRLLEAYCNEHKDQASPRFVLAYHYMTQGHAEAAAKQFREVLTLQPGDQLSAQLVKLLDPNAAAPAATPVANTAPGVAPLPEDQFLGSWTASPSPGIDITLQILAEKKFQWSATVKGKTNTFGGEFTYGGDTLTLVSETAPPLVGKLTWADATRFTFQPLGGNPADPGLRFSRKP
jgi:tetratricopeptide (TPR) repeat protein